MRVIRPYDCWVVRDIVNTLIIFRRVSRSGSYVRQ